MEFNKKQPALLYLDKNGFYFYDASLASVTSLAFLDTSVKDMDVINGNSLAIQIKSFVDQYHITPSSITIVLSPNVTFEKDFIGAIGEAQDEEIKKFIDTIPFESVLSRQYPIEKGLKVIGFNEDIYIELKLGFSKCAISIEHVIPYQLLGVDQNLIQNLTTDNASQLLKRIDRLKQFNLIAEEKEKTPTVVNSTEKKEGKPKKNNTRLYAMGVTFIVLFAILGFMLLKH